MNSAQPTINGIMRMALRSRADSGELERLGVGTAVSGGIGTQFCSSEVNLNFVG
jgi:hypothetical protein